MSRLLPALILPALLLAAVGQAQSMGALQVCGDRRASAAEAARTCRMALDQGGLSPAQATAAAINLGAALMDLNQPALALQAYETALAAAPASALALAGRAAARDATGDRAGAAVDWNRAVDAAPADVGLRAGRAAFRLRAGNPAGALQDLDAGLARAPDDADMLFNRALALEALGRTSEADAALSALIARAPADAEALLRRGRLRAARDPAAGLADMDRAVAAAADPGEALVARGEALEALGRLDAAHADYRRAWELGHRSEALNEHILRIVR